MATTRTITDYESVDEAYDARTLAFWGDQNSVDETWTLEGVANLSRRLYSGAFHKVAEALDRRCCGEHHELVSINGEIWLLIFSYGH